jgi:hypothetical protein
MDRRDLLRAVAGTVAVAGCSELTDDSRNAPAEGNSSQSAQENSAQDGVGLTSQQRARFQEHGWTNAEIDCFGERTLATLSNPTQAEFNQEVAAKLQELDQTVATIERLTVELIVGKDDFGDEVVLAQHTFHGVKLKNTEFSPLKFGAATTFCPETTSTPTATEEPSILGLNLGEIKPAHVNQDGTVERTLKTSNLYASGSIEVSFYPGDKSKHTTPFETTITYPEPQLSIELTNVEVDNPEYSDTINLEFFIRVENRGSIPAEVSILGPDGLPISSEVMLRSGETLTETYPMFAGPDKQGETVTFAVGGDLGQPYAEATFTIPEA